MARSSVSDFPHRARTGDIIDLDHYMTSPVFQYANEELDEKCVIDTGSFEPRLPAELKGMPEYKVPYSRGPESGSYRSPASKRCSAPSPPLREARIPASDYSATHERARERDGTTEGSCSSCTFRDSRAPQKQYSLDSGVSDGGRCPRHRRRSGFHSNVDFYERRRKRDYERSSHKLRNRCTQQDLSHDRSQSSILKSLKAQQEKIDRLAALCEECLQPKRRGSKESSSSELSSSIATKEELVIPKKHNSSDKAKKPDGKVNETKTYKIIMRKLDELNRHFAYKQLSGENQRRAGREAQSSSGTKTSEVSVSDKGVCTSATKVKKHKPKKASARSATQKLPRKLEPSSSSSAGIPLKSRREKPERPSRRAPEESPESSVPESRRKSAGSVHARLRSERSGSLNSADARRLRQIYTAFAKNEFEPLSPRRSRIGDYDANMFGIKDYNLNDPISFYNRAKRLSRQGTRPPPPTKPEVNLCSLCRGYWSRLHVKSRELCKQILCCGDGVSLSSGLVKKE